MRIICKGLIIILCFLLSVCNSNAQFLTLYQKNNLNQFHILLSPTNPNLHKIVNINVFGGYGHTEILSFDNKGVLIDSVKLDFPILTKPLCINNYYYIVSYINDSILKSSSKFKIGVLKLDSNFNKIDEVVLDTIDYNTGFVRYVTQANLNNKMYVAIANSKFSGQGNTTLYMVDTLMNVLHSRKYNKAIINSLFAINNNLVVAGLYITIPFGQVQKVIMDTVFNVIDDYEISAIELQQCKNFSVQVSLNSIYTKIIPITPSKLFVIDNVSILDDSATCTLKQAVAACIIDTNNNITPKFLKISTKNLTMPTCYSTPVDYKYHKIYNVAMLTDTVSYDINPNLSLNLKPSSIVVTTLDTSGNIIWQKIFGGDMSYNPNNIVATLDSGCLVAGYRYNYTNPKVTNVPESFLLKLDKYGNAQFTSIKENNNYVGHKCYPNPTQNNLYFDVPFTASYNVQLFDLASGTIVYNNDNYANQSLLNTHQLSPSIYGYRIVNGSKIYTGKFVKE